MWWLAAILSAAAGSIHIALGLAHANGPRPHQVFFLTVGALQVLWSSLAWPDGPGDRGILAARLLNIGVLAVYTFSRTIGIPPGEVFDAGRSDMIAAGLEVALLIVLSRDAGLDLPSWATWLSTLLILTLMTVGVIAGFEGYGHFNAEGVHVH